MEKHHVNDLNLFTKAFRQSVELQAHLDSSTATLAWCWRVSPADGMAFGFTDHDCSLRFDGRKFEQESDLTANEIRSGANLFVDEKDASGALLSGRLTKADILDGRWANADVEFWRVNWQSPGQRVLLRHGAIDQIRPGG